jgi:hypothetical protein
MWLDTTEIEAGPLLLSFANGVFERHEHDGAGNCKAAGLETFGIDHDYSRIGRAASIPYFGTESVFRLRTC